MQGTTKEVQWVLQCSSSSRHCVNLCPLQLRKWLWDDLSFSPAMSSFQKYCNCRKFSAYVYTFAQSEGPRVYQLIFINSFAFPWYPCKMLAAILGLMGMTVSGCPLLMGHFVQCLSLLRLWLLVFLQLIFECCAGSVTSWLCPNGTRFLYCFLLQHFTHDPKHPTSFSISESVL